MAIDRCVTVEEDRRQEGLRILARAGALLSASLDYRVTLNNLAELLVPSLADWYAVSVIEDGRLQPIAVAHVDAARVDLARELIARYPPQLDAPAGEAQVIRTGEPEWYPEIDPDLLAAAAQDDDHRRILQGLGLRSGICVPLTARDRPLGALTLVMAESGRRYAREDLELAQEIGRRAAVAIDNARLYRQSRDAERRYRDLVDGLDLIVWEADTDSGRVTFVNRRAEALLGYPVGRWAEEPDFAAGLVHPDDRARVLAVRREVVDLRSAQQVEFRAVAADGRVVWLRERIAVDLDAEGRPSRLGGRQEEITEERARAETEARQARQAALSSDVVLALTETGPLRPTLQRCCEAMVRRLDAEFARIWTIDACEEALDLQASAGRYTHLDGPHSRVPIGQWKIGRIALEAAPHLTNDVLNDPRIGDPEWARREGMVAFAGYPLVVDGRVIGVMAMFASRPLSGETLAALASVADAIALGVRRKQTEESLRESEARFRQIAENSLDIVWLYDCPSMRLLYVGPAYEAIWGRPVADLYAAPASWIESVHPDDRDALERAVETRLTTGEYDEVYRIVRPDGSTRWIRERAFPIADPNGVVHRVAGVTEDFTDRKRTEDRLVEETRSLETLNRIGGAVAAELDLDRLVRSVTDAGTELTRARMGAFFYNVRDERGEWYTLYALSGASRAAFESFPMPRNTAIFGPTFRGEGPVRLDDVTQDERYGRSAPFHGMPAGHPPVRSYLAVPVVSRSGEVIGGLFFGHDQPGIFSEREERIAVGLAAQAAVAIDNARLFREARDNEERLVLAMEAGRMGSWEWSVRTGRVAWSPGLERLHGLEPGSFGGTFEEFQRDMHPEDRDRVLSTIRESVESRTEYRIEYRIVLPDGETKWIEARGQPFCDDDGEPTHMRGICMDVSIRKRDEEEIRHLAATLEQRVTERTAQLQEANRELEAFSYSVSHDLRAPLRHVGGFTDLLRKRAGAGLDEQSLRYLDTIGEAARSAGTLVDDLLAFSRMGRARLRLVHVDLRRLVDEVVAELRAEEPGRAIEWRIADLPEVEGDAGLLRLVWRNLLSNAVKYSRNRDPATIEVDFERGQSETIFIVRDNGVGFEMQYSNKLFGVFQRLHRAEEFEGTGIGLANVRRIVHRHGGRTWARGAVDQGATFYFALPDQSDARKDPDDDAPTHPAG